MLRDNVSFWLIPVLVVVAFVLMSCASGPQDECEWTCPIGGDVPEDCWCKNEQAKKIDAEIRSEVDRELKKKPMRRLRKPTTQ